MSLLKSLFRPRSADYPGWTICTPEQMQKNTDAIDRLYQKKQEGYWVKGFFSDQEVQQLRSSLAKWPPDTQIELSFGRTYGKTLMGSEADLVYYLGMSQKFIREVEASMQGSFIQKMNRFFTAVAGGRTVRIPQSEAGESYSPANIRLLKPEQGGLHAHIGNEFIHQYPELYPLAELATLEDQVSYFIVLEKPEKGGGLKIFDLNWEQTPERLINGELLYYSEERNRELDRWYQYTLEPEAGDLILFAGGRIWHQVADLSGSQPRITIGGFGAKSRDDRSFYYWS